MSEPREDAPSFDFHALTRNCRTCGASAPYGEDIQHIASLHTGPHAEVEDLLDATYVYLTIPGRAHSLHQVQIGGHTYRLYINATAAPSPASKDED